MSRSPSSLAGALGAEKMGVTQALELGQKDRNYGEEGKGARGFLV